jgi:hypothetical protein
MAVCAAPAICSARGRGRAQSSVDPVGHLALGRLGRGEGGTGRLGEFRDFFLVGFVRQLVGG